MTPTRPDQQTLSLAVSQISKRYGAVVALKDVTFSLRPGEIRALYGGNGSGKSTAAKIVGGAVRPDAGAVVIDGLSLEGGSPRLAQASGVAITYQELSLLPELTVAENLAFARMPRRWWAFRDQREIYRQALDILQQVELAHLATLPISALQVGEKYLIELAKALLLRPRYIVLDEITSALHNNEAALVWRILREHQANGGGTLFVSHRVQEILEICDSITVLRNGEVAADDRIENVNAQTLVRWAGGSSDVESEASSTISAPNVASAPARLAISGLRLSGGATPLSVSVGRGEIFGLGGLPDQGQQEILSTIFGDRRDHGAEIRIDGLASRLKSPQDAVRAGIAYVAGDRDEVGFRSTSIAENLQAILLNREGKPRAEASTMRASLASMSTLYEVLSQPLNSLSGGNQQKVLLARCFVVQPKVLLAADPTKGIDVAARAEVHHSIRRLARGGACIILTSSDDSELADLCDRVMVLERKSLKCELSRQAGTLTQQSLVEAYLRQEHRP
jgi:ABC-type sugar transport system ATPase subunit